MKNKKFAGILLAGMMAVSAVGTPAVMTRFGIEAPPIVIQTIEADAASAGRLYNQNDSQWKKKTYYWNGKGDTLYNSGCGLFSLANAVYALNGKKMNMDTLATWAAKNGSWRPGSGGTYRNPFYKNAASVYGNTYGFKHCGEYYGKVTDTRLINWLKSGKVAVIHVSGHFMAITGYSNEKYRVIESAVWSGRGLSAESWVTTSKMSSGKTNVDWYCLLDSSTIPNKKYFSKYTGKSSSIVEALKAVGVDSSYSYRTKIYNKNFSGTYSGTASQNTSMLNLLKQGKLVKP